MDWRSITGPVLMFVAFGCGPLNPPTTPSAASEPTAASGPGPFAGPCSTRNIGENGSGTETLFEYAADGKLVRARTFDAAADPTADPTADPPQQERFLEYDEERRRRKELVLNGAEVHAVYSHYDDRGLLVMTEEDADGGGTIVRRSLREYDEDAKLVRRRGLVVGPDDQIRTVMERELSYDAQGRLFEERIVDDGELRVVRVVVGDEGQVRVRLVDRAGDGTTDETETYAYTADGRLQSVLTAGPAGVISSSTHEYDTNGNPTSTEFADASGKVTLTATHTYDCWAD